MRLLSSFIFLTLTSLTSAALDQHHIACNSFGISDGYQGHKSWRASAEHCQAAIDNLGPNFGKRVPTTEHGCVVLAESDDCEVRICDDYNVKQMISYTTVWTAANAIHARHRGGQTVAGYVSIDDYTVGGNLFRRFVMLAKKGSPDPHSKRRRSLFGRPVARGIDGPESEVAPPTAPAEELARRDDDPRNQFDLTVHPIPDTDDLNVNVIAMWGTLEWTGNDQMQGGRDQLLQAWRGGNGSNVRAPGYLAGNGVMVEMEFGAHHFQPVDTVHEEERVRLLNHLIHLRGINDNYGNFAAQVRRGDRTIGHVIIRVFRAAIGQDLRQVCG